MRNTASKWKQLEYHCSFVGSSLLLCWHSSSSPWGKLSPDSRQLSLCYTGQKLSERRPYEHWWQSRLVPVPDSIMCSTSTWQWPIVDTLWLIKRKDSYHCKRSKINWYNDDPFHMTTCIHETGYNWVALRFAAWSSTNQCKRPQEHSVLNQRPTM